MTEKTKLQTIRDELMNQLSNIQKGKAIKVNPMSENELNSEIQIYKEAIEELKSIEIKENYKICKNCEDWQNECCMQTEFEIGTKAEDKCFIVGFRAKNDTPTHC